MEARTPHHKEAGVRAAVHLTWRGPLLFGGDSGPWGLSMPRVCLGGEHAAWLIADCAPGGSGERQKGHKQITGQETTGRPSGLLLLSPFFPSCFPGHWRTGPSVFVPSWSSRGLPGSHGPGMCSLLHFYHNNPLINSPAAAAVAAETCASEGVGHVALPEPREGLDCSALPPPRQALGCRATGNSWCSLAGAKHVFGEVTFNTD